MTAAPYLEGELRLQKFRRFDCVFGLERTWWLKESGKQSRSDADVHQIIADSA